MSALGDCCSSACSASADWLIYSTELALGALAAAFAQLFTIPVSVIATRQQLSNKSVSFLTTLKDILADDGITGLWRGLKPSLVLTINPAITYGMFERLKTAFLKEGEKMTPGKAFVIGALSKTMATVVRLGPAFPVRRYRLTAVLL